MWSEDKNIRSKIRLAVVCVFRWLQYRIFVGLEEGVGRGTDEFHGKIRVSFLLIKLLPKRDTGSLGISQNTKPALLVEVPKFKPFVKQVLWNAEALTELFYGAKGGKVLPQKTQNKEQAETGVKRLGENGERTDSNRIKRTFVYGIQAIFISKESKCNRPEYLAGDRV